MQPIGISFAPTSDNDPRQVAGSPLQRAIQLISLRVPRVAGARQPIPQSILAGSPTARVGGSPVSAVVESVLRSLTGGQVPAGAAGPITGTGEAPQLAQTLASYSPSVVSPGTVAASQRAPIPASASPPPPVITPGLHAPPSPLVRVQEASADAAPAVQNLAPGPAWANTPGAMRPTQDNFRSDPFEDERRRRALLGLADTPTPSGAAATVPTPPPGPIAPFIPRGIFGRTEF